MLEQSKRTVLILGGTNFMGRTLLDALGPSPYRICCINRGKVYWNNEARIKHPEVEWFCADRKDHKDYSAAIRFAGKHLGISASNKWAAVIDFCGYKWRDVQSAVKAVEGLTDKYIFISTDSVYNNTHYKSKEPIAEHHFDIQKQYQRLKKDKQSNDSYGYDKMKCELYLRRTAKVPFIILRLPDVFGPYDSTERFWTTLTWMHHSREHPLPLSAQDQTAKLSFVDSESVARCIVQLICAPLPPSRTYNLASKETPTLQEFLSTMQQILGIEVQYIATPKRSSNHCYPSVESGPVSSNLASQEIAWQPLPIVEAIRRSIEFFTKQGENYSEEKRSMEKCYRRKTQGKAD